MIALLDHYLMLEWNRKKNTGKFHLNYLAITCVCVTYFRYSSELQISIQYLFKVSHKMNKHTNAFHNAITMCRHNKSLSLIYFMLFQYPEDLKMYVCLLYKLHGHHRNTHIFLDVGIDKYHSYIFFSDYGILLWKGSPSESMRVHFPSFCRNSCVVPYVFLFILFDTFNIYTLYIGI